MYKTPAHKSTQKWCKNDQASTQTKYGISSLFSVIATKKMRPFELFSDGYIVRNGQNPPEKKNKQRPNNVYINIPIFSKNKKNLYIFKNN